ncbi:hypothetical protein SBI_06669 [Streptomyces bingchenggensis BCW-1]|uniref:Uncharacterized protein n=1 Tax=Streptomyces bingchenggensis (strain BCW-1) TaxID=749414 RepID=D7BXP1_STRBB|nr:hypothetical protein SBI_06669 [Streptomyces bingchenggensis BCW-1]
MGPVSSGTGAVTCVWVTPGGGAGMASPSIGAGRLVPGTQAAPFQ